MSNIKHFPNAIIEVNGNDELFIDESTLDFFKNMLSVTEVKIEDCIKLLEMINLQFEVVVKKFFQTNKIHGSTINIQIGEWSGPNHTKYEILYRYINKEK